MRALPPDECAEAVVVLSQYAAFLTRACQREEARMAWAADEINKAVAPRLGQQKGYGLEERRLTAVAENEHASALERVRAEAQAKFKRLLYVSNRVEGVAKAYQNLSNVRRREMQYGRGD